MMPLRYRVGLPDERVLRPDAEAALAESRERFAAVISSLNRSDRIAFLDWLGGRPLLSTASALAETSHAISARRKRIRAAILSSVGKDLSREEFIDLRETLQGREWAERRF